MNATGPSFLIYLWLVENIAVKNFFPWTNLEIKVATLVLGSRFYIQIFFFLTVGVPSTECTPLGVETHVSSTATYK